MKEFALAALIGVMVFTYSLDSYWHDGQYYGALVRMLSDIYRHFW